MWNVRRVIAAVLMSSALAGCCGTVKDAVSSYGIAVTGEVDTAQALLIECAKGTQDLPSEVEPKARAEAQRKEACDRAKTTLTNIRNSANRLQGVK